MPYLRAAVNRLRAGYNGDLDRGRHSQAEEAEGNSMKKRPVGGVFGRRRTLCYCGSSLA